MVKPNIILLVLDAVRADHLSCYGYDRKTTPRIDEIITEGTMYTSAFSNSNWTGGAHPPIFTGLLPSHSGIYGDNLSFPDETVLLSEILRNEGYRTFATSAGGHIRKERGYSRGFDDFSETHRLQPNIETIRKMFAEPSYRKQARFSVTRGPDDKTLYKFERLKQFMRQDNIPTFAFINFKTAHYPYNPPRPFKTKFCPGLIRPKYEFLEQIYKKIGRQSQRLPGVDIEKCQMNPTEFMAEEFNVTDDEWSVIKSWYDGAIRYLDYRVADFIKNFQKTDGWNETYLIITADHGEMFGEKGLSSHKFSLYDSLLHVPLIIRPPGGGTERKITNPVSLIDLFNTILDMAEIPTREREHSRSLLADSNRQDYTFAEIGNKSKGWLENKYDSVKYSPHHIGPLQCVRDEEFKLIWDRNDSIEMYRWRKDPREMEEVSEEYPAECDRLLGILQKNTLEMEEKRQYNKSMDKNLRDTLKHLGYR